MQSYYIKPKAFYDSFGDVQPSQPYIYAYGDRPVFEFSFLPNEIAEGDTLVFAVDNDMVFYDCTPENLLHSASCMVVVRHDVTAEEATAGKVQMRIETRTTKFRDVVNGKVRPVDVISGLYRKRGDGDDINYVLLAKGRAMANGIIADYNALPEPITTDEYYTKGDIDDKLDAKADKADLVAHTDDTTIHVTQQEKTAWNSKADRNDIGNATVTITQGGTSKGSFSVNASENVTIDLTGGGAQADWDETDTSSPSYIQHKPSVYTQTEADGLLNAKADKATTLAGYGIADAYTKDEVDAKVSSVYHYRGTVSTYADLPSSGQEVGDVYNVETADSTHGIKAGDNVAWTGSEWDVLSGTVDLTPYATKTELETKMDAPATGNVGQVLTKTADGQEWADAKADAQTPVSYTTLNQSIKCFNLTNCKYSTVYNTQESFSGTFYLYGNNPSPNNVVVSPGETYDYPDLTIEYTLTENLTIKDTDSIDFLMNSPAIYDMENRTIARIYHGNDVIREGIYFYDGNSNSGSNTEYKTFSFENILKKGEFQYAIGDTLKIVILSRITNHSNNNLRLYFFHVTCHSGGSYLYINNTFFLWQKINNIETAIRRYVQQPTYNMSYTTSSYNGSYTIYLSNDYFTYNDPVNYSLGSDTTFDFDSVTNAGFLFKTGSDFTYTVVENSSHPMVVNKPIDFKPDKTYLIVIYYNMLFWTEVEDYGN